MINYFGNELSDKNFYTKTTKKNDPNYNGS